MLAVFSDKSLCSSILAIMLEHTMCSSNLQGTQVKERRARDLSPFLNRGQMFARDHSLGISPLSIDCWKRWANTESISVARD